MITINEELIKLGAIEVKELLEIWETNKGKSFDELCVLFAAEVEDINENEDEEPWLEAYAKYKHLSFCFCDDLEIRNITIYHKGKTEDIDTNEFNYTGRNFTIPVANERYYGNWLD
jgi:hypothetical protein